MKKKSNLRMNGMSKRMKAKPIFYFVNCLIVIALLMTFINSGLSANVYADDELYIEPGNVTLYIGESVTLYAGASVTWSSSSTGIVSVTSSGVATAKSAGTAIILAKAKSDDSTAECTVTVLNPSVSISQQSMTLAPGEVGTLTADLYPSGIPNQKITWSSDRTTVATVSQDGYVTAKSSGTATITAKASAGGATATCTVTVTPPSVSVSQQTLTLKSGETFQLSALFTPENAASKAVSWTSNNTSVASVSSSGVVTAKAVGTAQITVKANDGGSTSVCNVTVTGTLITMNTPVMSLASGSTGQLSVTFDPPDTINKKVTWSSSSSSIAAVASDGMVTAKSSGTATITAKADAGGATATCTVTVSSSGVTVSPAALTLKSGETSQLTVSFTPANTVNKSVAWSSNNTAVATVSSTGVVTAKAVGTAQITAKANDGGAASVCNVTVTGTLIAMDQSTMKIATGATGQLSVTFSPADTINKKVTWASSNAMIATVTSTGLVTARNSGSATITAKADAGGATTSCVVTVTPASISMSPASITMKVGETSEPVNVTFNPSNAYTKTISFSSDNYSVAYVGHGGVIKAIGPGSATITAKAADGGAVAICKVTVTGSKITLNKADLTLEVNETSQLTVKFEPEDTVNKSVSWSSNYSSVVSVSSGGLVTAKSPGTAVITVKATGSGNAIATCIVTVKSPPMELDFDTLSMRIGDTKTLTATFPNITSTNARISWISSDTSVASVTSGGVVTARKGGSAVITATAFNGEAVAKCTINVATISISLNYGKLTLDPGDTASLTVVFSPSDTANKSVIYSVGNSSVATVSADGKIKAVSPGTTTVKVTSVVGSAIATCVVTVSTPTYKETVKIIQQDNYTNGYTINYSNGKEIDDYDIDIYDISINDVYDNINDYSNGYTNDNTNDLNGGYSFDTAYDFTGANVPDAYESDITVVYNGQKLDFTMPILTVNFRTFYPMRQLLESIGADVGWIEETWTATGTIESSRVEFTIGSEFYLANGEVKSMDSGVYPFIYESRTYIPVRYACEALGCTVGWDESTSTIYISGGM